MRGRRLREALACILCRCQSRPPGYRATCYQPSRMDVEHAGVAVVMAAFGRPRNRYCWRSTPCSMWLRVQQVNTYVLEWWKVRLSDCTSKYVTCHIACLTGRRDDVLATWCLQCSNVLGLCIGEASTHTIYDRPMLKFMHVVSCCITRCRIKFQCVMAYHPLYSPVTSSIEVYASEARHFSLCFCAPLYCHYNLYNIH